LRVRIAVPTHDGKVWYTTAMALLMEMQELAKAKIEFSVSMLPGGSEISLARNVIANEFMAMEGYDKLVFLDSDVSFQKGDIVRLVSHKADVVGGVYRFKKDIEAYPIVFPEGATQNDKETGLFEVERLPAGFLCISRKAFEHLKIYHEKAGLKRTFKQPFQNVDMYAWFHVPPGMAEDTAFCDEWRSIGGKVYFDPFFTLTHTGGINHYTGQFAEFVQRKTAEFEAKTAEYEAREATVQ
jgi:hypothetical protein